MAGMLIMLRGGCGCTYALKQMMIFDMLLSHDDMLSSRAEQVHGFILGDVEVAIGDLLHYDVVWFRCSYLFGSVKAGDASYYCEFNASMRWRRFACDRSVIGYLAGLDLGPFFLGVTSAAAAGVLQALDRGWNAAALCCYSGWKTSSAL
ncbi:hypothetical protein Nepgr_033755 [Nepenthes gracilis]|uniref:Uncharacterized protein n=1 Tax=Nepenthes gracilis TaxID=150966 RepID=A0AAD3TMI6_NEPGR|nr:hypothetical protein Nepgr_033755 [Nepenthes gracilis]